jgi:hypothetical protein
MQDVSNWGRWGKDDELGSSNLMEIAAIILATALLARERARAADDVMSQEHSRTVGVAPARQ